MRGQRGLFACAALLLVASPATNAQAAHDRYDPLQTFARLTLPQPVNRYRSADGALGPDYWQNHADYVIHARLDTLTHRLQGHEVITYTNNSPTALDSLWVQLDQNMYREDSRAAFSGGFRRTQFTAGVELETVELRQNRRLHNADFIVSDTRMQIRLVQPLPHGGRLQILIRYQYEVPGEFGGRTAASRSSPSRWTQTMCCPTTIAATTC
jgi:hypothetical protein